MPHFHTTTRWIGRGLRAYRVVCDGCDAPRPVDEVTAGPRFWLLASGAFELRLASGRHVLDAGHAFLSSGGSPFQIRHPTGPDVCVSFQGPVVAELAARGDAILPIDVAGQAELARALAGWRNGTADELAVTEALVALAAPAGADRSREVRRASGAERAVAAAIAHVLGLHFAEAVTLDEIAARAGYSTFHACRAFRAATGRTIHDHRLELRLRQALALVLDGELPLADVAARAGFASQSHLTNRFRARFGTTPGRARACAGVTSP